MLTMMTTTIVPVIVVTVVMVLLTAMAQTLYPIRTVWYVGSAVVPRDWTDPVDDSCTVLIHRLDQPSVYMLPVARSVDMAFVVPNLICGG